MAGTHGPNKREDLMDELVRQLERKGMDRYQIASYLFEGLNEAESRKLKDWCDFLYRRSSHHDGWLAKADDEHIEHNIRNKRDPRHEWRKEGAYRKMTLYAQIGCCGENSCDMCKGTGVVTTRKVFFDHQKELHR